MKIRNEQEMMELGENLAKLNKKFVQSGDLAKVIELVGDVGVGKTTLVRGLAKELGVQEAVTSPSFTISRVYALPGGGNLVHYDFYRLGEPGLMVEDLAEVLAEPKNVVVVEWAGGVTEVLPEGRLQVEISYNDDGTREVECREGGEDE